MRKENFSCPVCGKHIFKTNYTDEMCPVCDWINDIIQNEDPDYIGGANGKSLNECRREWQEQHKK